MLDLVTGRERHTEGSLAEEVLAIWAQLVGWGEEGTDWVELQLGLGLVTFSLAIPRIVVCIWSWIEEAWWRFFGLLGLPDFSSSSSEKKTKSSSGLEIDASFEEWFQWIEELELLGIWAEGFPKFKIGDGVKEGVFEGKFIIGFQESGVEPLEPLALGDTEPCDMSMEPWDNPSRRVEISDKPKRLLEEVLADGWVERREFEEKLEYWEE